jgi:predicted DNA-binding transcriptional regulator AlpA
MNKPILSQEEDRLLTYKDIQYIFGVGKNRAYELLNSSGFPTLKIGNRMYVSKKALDEWIATYTFKTYLI